MFKKIIAALLVVTLTATVAIGGTLAYLTDRDSEANVFTVGNVDITLEEDFVQDSTLIPGVNIEKKPTITNTGLNDAWVWATVAIPAALDNDDASKNVVHFNYSEESIAEGLWNWKNSEGAWNVKKDVDIDGVLYNVYTVLYETALKPGETTEHPVMTKVYMDPHADITPEGDICHVENGVVTKLDWNINTYGEPVIYVSAYAMQTEGFATALDAYNAYQTQWGDNGSEYGKPIPADAVIVTNAQELKDAMLVRDAEIYLDEDISVDADTPLQWGSYMFVANGREVTINLNSHDIIVEEDAFKRANALFTTANGGTLNIEGEGTVEVKNTKSGIFHAMNKNDQINVYGGTYISNSDNGSDALAIIYTNSGNVDAYGGKFVSPAGVEHANAEDTQGGRLSIVFHEGALLNHEKYYAGSDVNGGRIKLADGCILEETVINGETWYKVVKA